MTPLRPSGRQNAGRPRPASGRGRTRRQTLGLADRRSARGKRASASPSACAAPPPARQPPRGHEDTNRIPVSRGNTPTASPAWPPPTTTTSRSSVTAVADVTAGSTRLVHAISAEDRLYWCGDAAKNVQPSAAASRRPQPVNERMRPPLFDDVAFPSLGRARRRTPRAVPESSPVRRATTRSASEVAVADVGLEQRERVRRTGWWTRTAWARRPAARAV